MINADLLSPERVVLLHSASSKKRVLEGLSAQLASAIPNLSEIEIFNSLIARERLGSTGLGNGVAIPHARMAGVEDAIGAVMKLEQGVDYDALDQRPVDLLFALLVPENATEKHLELLSLLAEVFSDATSLAKLRAAQDADSLLSLFNDEIPSHAA
jgi:PTS system nitrogen regulatory IIA component